MIIHSIKLVNFRNHSAYSLVCDDETSLILGENGCGKTSVLEAIYIATRGKSFRATDPEIIKRGAPFYRVELEYKNHQTVIITYDGQNKFFQIADKKSRRLPAKNKYPVILFLPSDLNLISHSPSRRRDYFDAFLSILFPDYASALSKYQKTLRQRNEILKSDHISATTLFSWNLLLARYGSFIAKTRSEAVERINEKLTDIYHSIAKNSDQIEIFYKSDAADLSESAYLARLEQNFDKDRYLEHTSFGIHRDDYLFNFNNKPADGSASRGETRSIILALKFIEAEQIEKYTGKKPLILLDDVFSELDETRRQCLVDNFKHHQVIITSVERFDKTRA